MQEYLQRQDLSVHSTLSNAPLQFRQRTTSQKEAKVLSKTFGGVNYNVIATQENQLTKCVQKSKEQSHSKVFLKVGNHQKLTFQKNRRLKNKVQIDGKKLPVKPQTDRVAFQTLSCTNIDNLISKIQRKFHKRSSSGEQSLKTQSTATDQIVTSFKVLPPQTTSLPVKIADFELGQCIGSGKFGDVYICRHKTSRMLFGLKKVLKSTILQNCMMRQFITQLKIQYKLCHPNIIKLYTHFDDEYHIFLLMEYAPSGTLMSRIHNTEKYTSQVMEQMLEAVSYTHQQRIIHRDIKPENIVVFFEDTFKLCDFGLAAFLDHDNDIRTSFCGTLDYIAPEMKDIGLYSFSVDIWGLGVLCYEVLFGKAPFKEEISKWKKRGGKRFSNWNWKIDYPSFTTQKALDFMSNFLKQNPNQRMSLLTALHSEFITTHKTRSCQLNPCQESLVIEDR